MKPFEPGPGRGGEMSFWAFLRSLDGYDARHMQDSEVIKLVKPVPSDRLAIQVLVTWYNTVRPSWKKPLDLVVTGFFVLMTLYSFSLRPLPIFAWFSLAGALAAVVLSWFYVPFLARTALAANKKVPMYYKEKDYVFHEQYMTFSCEGMEPINIPYDRFTTLCRGRQALLFLVGKKLVLWLPLHIMKEEQVASVLNRFRNHGVEVREVA